MTEFELIQIIEAATAQTVVLLSQIIAINFTMIVAIYYFLHRAGIWLKLSAFLLYLIGSLMFLLFAVRESNIVAGAQDTLETLSQRSAVTETMFAFSESFISSSLTILINLLFWAMMAGTTLLLFFWRRPTN